MDHNPFKEMQKAVDIVNTSVHPRNKVAATIFGKDTKNHDFSTSYVNYWPDIIKDKIQLDTRIGDSSGTIHAETACIIHSPYTKDANICVTDLFCPNCAKNMAEAGIRRIYVDHKGFEKDFAQRRGIHFTNMSMRICEQAGIEVFKINRKLEELEAIYTPPQNFLPEEDSPVDIKKSEPEEFRDLVINKREENYNRRFAVAIGKNTDGRHFSITSRSHPSVGYTHYKHKEELRTHEGKYSFILEPVNRLMMNAAKFGLKLVDGCIYSSRVPTSREQVNLVGAGISEIYVGNTKRARDNDALHAANLLSFNAILKLHEFDNQDSDLA